MVHENERLRESVRTEQTRAARARQLSRDISAAADTGPLFTDPVEQFRHEIYVEWTTRIPAAAKAEMPLAEYGLAEGFLPSVERIQGVDRTKIVAVAVEVLTGIADGSPGRDMHRLRNGPKVGTGYIEHPEYGTAWRVGGSAGRHGRGPAAALLARRGGQDHVCHRRHPRRHGHLSLKSRQRIGCPSRWNL